MRTVESHNPNAVLDPIALPRSALRFPDVPLPPLAIPPQSPNLNAFDERRVSFVRQECLSKLVLIDEASLRRATTEYMDQSVGPFRPEPCGFAQCSSRAASFF
jgi:hypothetical protein